jgi:hypothetical protein
VSYAAVDSELRAARGADEDALAYLSVVRFARLECKCALTAALRAAEIIGGELGLHVG